jgi:serine O-acetyltransferase
MLDYVLQDFENREFMKTIKIIITDSGSSAVFLYRCSSWCYNKKFRFFAYMLQRLNEIINSCNIGLPTEIGQGLSIKHSLGMIIVAGCKIGNNLSIWQNVTIGKNGKVDISGNGVPSIGDNVSLFAGCKILGPICIGNNAKVGANAVVINNISQGSTAVGVPARVIDCRGIENEE